MAKRHLYSSEGVVAKNEGSSSPNIVTISDGRDIEALLKQAKYTMIHFHGLRDLRICYEDFLYAFETYADEYAESYEHQFLYVHQDQAIIAAETLELDLELLRQKPLVMFWDKEVAKEDTLLGSLCKMISKQFHITLSSESGEVSSFSRSNSSESRSRGFVSRSKKTN